MEGDRDLAVGLRPALEDAGYVVELSFDRGKRLEVVYN